MKYIAGVDEAGRGCIIGPMVMCIVSCTPKQAEELRKIGVKDSKKLNRKTREELSDLIRKITRKIAVEKIEPKIIDAHNINFLEASVTAKFIKKINPSLVYLDAPVAKPGIDKYIETVKYHLKINKTKIIGENFADSKYPIVSAASIIAKVVRDREIDKLKKIYGDFGSGYTSDKKTILFLAKCRRNFPKIVRLKWSTLNRLEQQNLFKC